MSTLQMELPGDWTETKAVKGSRGAHLKKIMKYCVGLACLWGMSWGAKNEHMREERQVLAMKVASTVDCKNYLALNHETSDTCRIQCNADGIVSLVSINKHPTMKSGQIKKDYYYNARYGHDLEPVYTAIQLALAK